MKGRVSPVLTAAVLAMILTTAGIAVADDIAKAGDVDSLYSDHRAYKVGDIVTILVVESTQGSQSASIRTNKNQAMGGGMGLNSWGTSSWGGGYSTAFPYVYGPTWGAAGGEYQQGGGKSVRSGSLMGKVSARVEKVLSNGNLVIKGSKVIRINDDRQNLVVKGVIRAEDIDADNTIYSTYVANADIQYEGKGPIGEKTSPGILTRILDWLGLF